MKRLVCIIVLTVFVLGLAVPSPAVPSSDVPEQTEEVPEWAALGCLLFVALIAVAVCGYDGSDSRDTGPPSRHQRDHRR
jgi:hypothetical protein